MSANGTAEKHGNDYGADYLTDLLKNHTVQFITHAAEAGEPFFAVVVSCLWVASV